MTSKTTHIIPSNGGWAVKKEDGPKRDFGVYSTQKEAIDAARSMARRASAWQIVLHGRDGSFRLVEAHGLRAVQKSPLKSHLGTKAIKRAVSAVIRERLEGK